MGVEMCFFPCGTLVSVVMRANIGKTKNQPRVTQSYINFHLNSNTLKLENPNSGSSITFQSETRGFTDAVWSVCVCVPGFTGYTDTYTRVHP